MAKTKKPKITIEGYVYISMCDFCKKEIIEAVNKGWELELLREGNTLHLVALEPNMSD